MLIEVRQILKELHKEVLLELFELNRAYPFGQIKEELPNEDGYTEEAYCIFKGKDNIKYTVQLTRSGENNERYTFEFFPMGQL